MFDDKMFRQTAVQIPPKKWPLVTLCTNDHKLTVFGSLIIKVGMKWKLQ